MTAELNFFHCEKCEKKFRESTADCIIRQFIYNEAEESMQASLLIYCPYCGVIFTALFESLPIEQSA